MSPYGWQKVKILPYKQTFLLIWKHRYPFSMSILVKTHSQDYSWKQKACICCTRWSGQIFFASPPPPRTETSVDTQCSAGANEAFSEASYLAQIEYQSVLLFKMQGITLRWNCIMMCRSISPARGRRRQSPSYLILLDRHVINLLSWVLFFPRQLLVLLYACFSLNSYFFTDTVNTCRIPRMSALCRCIHLFGRNNFPDVSWNYTHFFHSHLTAVLANLLRPVSQWPWSSIKNWNYCF